ncbi:MAG: hypothetical protein KIS80_04235 [Anaerolineales bacterium]|nr:hypothetical protein [Anaerolineales bacterium]
MLNKKRLLLALIGLLLGSSLLTACAGGTRVDIDLDPETGQGSIDIIGVDGQNPQDGTSSTGLGTDNVIVLAVVAALFIAVIALVIALVSRRPTPPSG